MKRATEGVFSELLNDKSNRPLHGLRTDVFDIPALKCWAMFTRPPRGLVELLFVQRLS